TSCPKRCQGVVTEYRLSPQAQQDIDTIWDYIAQDNPSAATHFRAIGEKVGVVGASTRTWPHLRRVGTRDLTIPDG
ncbi:MAG: type II toxin-antitoxin system RelE/ParE family toxin, partial [Candidatus Hydrogenedentes bacterium]|nr:type II toxin-antitoxin system RelE/ParE family toxin [Candidatus Hydrogenedentota bacterium]